MPLRILLLEDSPTHTELVRAHLEMGLSIAYELECVTTLADAQSKLKVGTYDLVITDLNVPDSEGLDTFLAVHGAAGISPIVVTTGESEEETAILAMRNGAEDYLVKGEYDHGAMARCVRFAIERSRRVKAERELRVAEEVQSRLHPQSGPRIPGFDIEGVSYPAETMGGDFYDFIPMTDRAVGITLGDASGHGLGSAMMMAQARAYLRSITDIWRHLRAIARSPVSPGDVLNHANQLLLPEHSGGSSFLTLFYARLDSDTRYLEYAAAGHEALLFRGGEARRLHSTGTVLGLIDSAEFPTAAPIHLEPGDLLLIPSDGIADSHSPNGGHFGMHRVIEVVERHRDAPAREIVVQLLRAAREFADGGPQRDDMTAVVVKVLPPNAPT